MANVKKIDFKKEFPEYYKPSTKQVAIIEIPKMNFFMIDGKGDPNTSEEYKHAIECLYAISYTLKMKIIKKQTPSKDYVVPPLEGLWFMEDMSKWDVTKKEDWEWTMMIRIPDYVKPAQIKKALELTKETKNPPAFPKLYIKEYVEGKCVQIMHIGPYADEGPNIQKMHNHALDNGYKLAGKHHEIYLSDPRKADPTKMKTILRQPIKKM